jgi:PhnB protein
MRIMEIAPYLIFNGNCAEAFPFYERVLGGRIVMMQTHGESPMKDQVGADWHDKVLHARMEAGNFVLMGSDAPPSEAAVSPRDMHVSVSTGAADAERLFNALAAGGRVTMPFEKTFWSPGFGMVVDRFGTPWMVNTDPAR